MPTLRIISGREFKWYWSFQTIEEAQRMAKMRRSDGYYTRITNEGDPYPYNIWSRRKDNVKGK